MRRIKSASCTVNLSVGLAVTTLLGKLPTNIRIREGGKVAIVLRTSISIIKIAPEPQNCLSFRCPDRGKVTDIRYESGANFRHLKFYLTEKRNIYERATLRFQCANRADPRADPQSLSSRRSPAGHLQRPRRNRRAL